MSDPLEYERVLIRRMREDTHEARPRPSRARRSAGGPRTRPEAQAGSQSRRSVASLDDALPRARRSRSARALSRLQRCLVGPRRRDVRGRARWPAIRDVREPRARDSGAPAPTIPPTSTPSPAWRPALFHAIAPRLLRRGDARPRRRRALDGRRGPREVGECAEYTTWPARAMELHGSELTHREYIMRARHARRGVRECKSRSRPVG